MNIKNCRKCGKMFNPMGTEVICPACKELAEEEFQKVRKYVEEHKQAPINEIVEECHVDPKQIKQWIREERLFFSDDSPVKISCELCGCQISTGRFCDNCKKSQASNFSNAARRPEPPKPDNNSAPRGGVKMHTFQG